jgi:hemoglobin
VSDGGGQILPYELVGGEAGLRKIVDRFYEIMDQDADAATIRAMHGADLGPIREKLFEFLSGWLGGPPLYSKRTGSICITEAHKPFAIGTAERDQWMACMRQALVDCEVSAETREMLDTPLFRICDFLRNRD